jgi:hypothetical protein
MNQSVVLVMPRMDLYSIAAVVGSTVTRGKAGEERDNVVL